MPNFGPFETYSEALVAACPFILAKPHAIAGRPSDPHFALNFRLATEYCAWIYRTPDNKFEMSMLATSAVQDDPRKRKCALPPHVNDPRYPTNNIDYVFVIHSHPYMDEPRDDDIEFIVEMGRLHGFFVKTGDRDIPISIVAFFSNSSDVDRATCDGFFQYFPSNGEITRWTPKNGKWTWQQIATVRWTSATRFVVERR